MGKTGEMEAQRSALGPRPEPPAPAHGAETGQGLEATRRCGTDERISVPAVPAGEQLRLFEVEKGEEFAVPPSEFVPGSVWRLGRHTLAMLDATREESYGHLRSLGALGEKGADVVFADPPYGMGKSADGVDNDNQNAASLRAFSDAWVPLSVAAMAPKGSWMAWGSSSSILELYGSVRPLIDSRELVYRNLIVWDKVAPNGRNSAMRCFTPQTELCLFLARGWPSFDGAEWFFKGYEPLRQHMQELVAKVGGVGACNRILGNQIASHYVSHSEWLFPTREAYIKLAKAAGMDSKEEYERAKEERKSQFPHFDNQAEHLTDVIRCFPASNTERTAAHSFPAIKPQTVVRKLLRVVTPPGGVVLDPFCGSGSTLLACEGLKRQCATLEVNPRNAAIAVDRWVNLYGGNPERIE